MGYGPEVFRPTKTMLTMIRDECADPPLEPGEFRRIQGMGAMYVSHTKVEDDRQMVHWATLSIDGVDVYLYRQITDAE